MQLFAGRQCLTLCWKQCANKTGDDDDDDDDDDDYHENDDHDNDANDNDANELHIHHEEVF